MRTLLHIALGDSFLDSPIGEKQTILWLSPIARSISA
jgi:hypothetical protein